MAQNKKLYPIPSCFRVIIKILFFTVGLFRYPNTFKCSMVKEENCLSSNIHNEKQAKLLSKKNVNEPTEFDSESKRKPVSQINLKEQKHVYNTKKNNFSGKINVDINKKEFFPRKFNFRIKRRH